LSLPLVFCGGGYFLLFGGVKLPPILGLKCSQAFFSSFFFVLMVCFWLFFLSSGEKLHADPLRFRKRTVLYSSSSKEGHLTIFLPLFFDRERDLWSGPPPSRWWKVAFSPFPPDPGWRVSFGIEGCIPFQPPQGVFPFFFSQTTL